MSHDAQGIESLFAEYTTAWTSKNARRCAELFHEHADLIALDGTLCHGPEAVAAYYERQLNGAYKDLKVEDMQFEPVRFFAPNLAVMNAQWRVAGFRNADGTQRAPTLVRSSFAMTQRSGEWCFAAARFMVPFAAGL